MYPNRSRGYVGSNGTYAPPAFNTPSNPTTISTDRSTQIPTKTSGPTPNPHQIIRQPIRPPVQLPIPNPLPLKLHRHRPRLLAPPAPRTSPTTDPTPTSSTPPFHSSNNRRLSPSPSIPNRDTLTPASPTTDSSNLTK